MNTEQIHLGKRIAAIRDGIGLSQGQLAQKLGVSQQMISRWEGSSNLEPETLNRFAEGLGVTPEYIKNYIPQRGNIQTNSQNYGNSKQIQKNFEAEQINYIVSPELVDRLENAYKEVIKTKDEMIELLKREKGK